MEEQAGQVLRMARPAAYWARRAAVHHRRGNRHQAEALLRHAVTLTPDNLPLKLSYARVLQELHRYEASNRQAFAALSQDPDFGPCIGLIGQNLMALGYLEEAADAFAHALYSDSPDMAELHAEQLDRLEAMLPEPVDCGVRYHIVVQRAAEDLAAGDWEHARQLLLHACAMPKRDERCHTLLSLYYKTQDDLRHAMREAAAACRAAPQSVRARCALAELYGANGQRGQAMKALLLAAARVLTAEDERQVCQTALTLNFPAAALPMLERIGAHVRTLYNKGVLLLMAGQAERALQALEQCRALDPDDVPSRYLLRTAQTLTALPPNEAAAYAGGLRLYPALPDADNEACYRDFMQAYNEGADVFARRLQADPSLCRLTLYQAENPHTDIAGMLEQVFPYLSENFTLRLLREILLLPTGGIAEKQLALRVLMHEMAKPFVLWYGGRLSFIRPHAGGGTAEELRLKDYLLRGGAELDSRLLTHAMRLIRRMPPRARAKAAAAQGGAFLRAVEMHYIKTHAPAAPQAAPRLRHVRRLYQMLLRVAPPSVNDGKPKLWISRRRKETP